MRKLIIVMFLISFIALNSSFLTACNTKPNFFEVPPVFESIGSFHDQSFNTINLPRVYSNINESYVSQDLSVELKSEVNPPTVPTILNTYRIVRPNVDEKYARNIAKQVGFNEPIQEKSQTWPFHQSRYFYIPASDSSKKYSLGISQDGSIAISYVESAWVGNIPSDKECIDIASDWLKSHDIYPKGVIDIQTSPTIILVMAGWEERQYTIATTVSFLIGVDGYELYGMGAYVSVGDNGEIYEIYINTPRFEKYSIANIKDPELAIDDLRDYLKEPSKFCVYSPECLIDNIEPDMTINEVSLIYFPMLNNDFDQPTYAQPIYIIKGQAYPKSSSTYSFVARVDATVR